MNSSLKRVNYLHIINDGFHASLFLLLPFIVKELGLNLFQAGLVGSVGGVMEIVMAIPAGVIAYKIGGFKLLKIALFIYALGFVIIFYAFNFYSVLFLFVFANLGFSLFHPVAFALVAKVSEIQKLGRSMGDFTALGDLGRFGLGSLLTFFIALYGWRYTSLGYGVFAIALLFVYYLFFNLREIENLVVKSKGVSFKDYFRNRKFILVSASGFLDTFASASLYVFIPFLLLYKGVSVSWLGFFTGAFFVGNLFGKILLGRVVDKFDGVVIFCLSELLMCISILALIWTQNVYSFIVLGLILGIFTKGTVPILQTLVSKVVERHENYEKAFGLNALIVSFGGAISPIVFGYLSNRYSINIAFYAAALCSLVAIVPFLMFRISSINNS